MSKVDINLSVGQFDRCHHCHRVAVVFVVHVVFVVVVALTVSSSVNKVYALRLGVYNFY